MQTFSNICFGSWTRWPFRTVKAIKMSTSQPVPLWTTSLYIAITAARLDATLSTSKSWHRYISFPCLDLSCCCIGQSCGWANLSWAECKATCMGSPAVTAAVSRTSIETLLAAASEVLLIRWLLEVSGSCSRYCRITVIWYGRSRKAAKPAEGCSATACWYPTIWHSLAFKSAA